MSDYATAHIYLRMYILAQVVLYTSDVVFSFVAVSYT